MGIYVMCHTHFSVVYSCCSYIMEMIFCIYAYYRGVSVEEARKITETPIRGTQFLARDMYPEFVEYQIIAGYIIATLGGAN